MKYLLQLLILLPFFACQSQQDKIDKLEAEVIFIHDEVMPKNIDINRVQRNLKGFLQDSTLNQETVTSINSQVRDLSLADQAMSTWMAEYKAPSKDFTFEQAMEHLNQEKVKITEVKDLMLNSLKNGQELLAKLKREQPMTTDQ